jgi:hypothetical protein
MRCTTSVAPEDLHDLMPSRSVVECSSNELKGVLRAIERRMLVADVVGAIPTRALVVVPDLEVVIYAELVLVVVRVHVIHRSQFVHDLLLLALFLAY